MPTVPVSTRLDSEEAQLLDALAESSGVDRSTLLKLIVRRGLAELRMDRAVDEYRRVGKREVRSPTVYLADSGLLHLLLEIREMADLEGHPKIGASFEGFAIAQVVRALGADPEECFCWGLHTGAELDLLIVRGRRRLGFEVKRSSSPAMTRSMRSAVEALGLERLDLIYPGTSVFPLADRIRAVGIGSLLDALSG